MLFSPFSFLPLGNHQLFLGPLVAYRIKKIVEIMHNTRNIDKIKTFWYVCSLRECFSVTEINEDVLLLAAVFSN